MRAQALTHAAALCNASAAVRTPPLNRLLIFWPRYIQVKSQGSRRTFKTGLARSSQRESKAFSTAIEAPATGINLQENDRSTDADTGLPSSSPQAQAVDSRYDDPREYLDDYEIEDGQTLTGNHALAASPAQPQVVDSRYNDPQGYLDDYGMSLPQATVQQWHTDLEMQPPVYALDKYETWRLQAVATSRPIVKTLNHLLGDAQAVKQHNMPEDLYKTGSPWRKAFLRLHAQFDPFIAENLRHPELLADARAEAWARPFLEADQDTQRSLWLNLDGTLASEIWGHVMLYTAYKHPERAMEMLSVSMSAAPHYSAPELIFSFSINYAQTLLGQPRRAAFEQLYTFLYNSLQPGHIVAHRTLSRAIGVLRQERRYMDDLKMYQKLRDRGFRLSSWTNLHFADSLAKSGHLMQALECIRFAIQNTEITRLPLGVTDIKETGAFRSVLNTLLRALISAPDGYQISLQITSRLLQLGVTLNTPLTNVLMLNALEAGDKATCLGLYHATAENGLRRDEYTYDFALRALRDSVDTDQVQAVANEALTYRGPGESYVFNAVLRCLGSFYEADSPHTTFQRLLVVYQQHFDVEPLVKLGVVPAAVKPSPALLRDPNPATLHIMLYYFLTAEDVSPARVWSLWQRLRQLMRLEARFALCGTSEYFYATFIHALGQHKSHLKCCSVIFKDMTRHSITDGSGDKFNPDLTHIAPAAPGSATMNSLLQAYMRHGHSAAADQVRAIMKERNIAEDVITYNTLINWYSRKQDIERASAALKELQGAGFQTDRYTAASLRHIKDRARLHQVLEESNASVVSGRPASSVFAPLLDGDSGASDTTHLAVFDDGLPSSPADARSSKASSLRANKELMWWLNSGSKPNSAPSWVTGRADPGAVVMTDMQADSPVSKQDANVVGSRSHLQGNSDGGWDLEAMGGERTVANAQTNDQAVLHEANAPRQGEKDDEWASFSPNAT